MYLLDKFTYSVMKVECYRSINSVLYTRGVSDVGFQIFADADTDADFAF